MCALPLAGLSVGYSPREVKVDAGHVAALMEVVDHLPPVIVDHRTMTVIDGVHRLEAFRRAGRSHIKALMFNGEGPEAMALAIQANVKHGKPLSRGERRFAARNLLYAFPERSDRWVGEVCGLSHTTVALVRRGLSLNEARVRTGRDGRRRPVDKLAGQMAVARAMVENPATSVRQMAGAAGVAPSTVQRARTRLRGKEAPPPVSASLAVQNLSDPHEFSRANIDLSPGAQPTEPGDWLCRTAVAVEDLGNYLGNLPLSRVYEVADECRRRASTGPRSQTLWRAGPATAPAATGGLRASCSRRGTEPSARQEPRGRGPRYNRRGRLARDDGSPSPQGDRRRYGARIRDPLRPA